MAPQNERICSKWELHTNRNHHYHHYYSWCCEMLTTVINKTLFEKQSTHSLHTALEFSYLHLVKSIYLYEVMHAQDLPFFTLKWSSTRFPYQYTRCRCNFTRSFCKQQQERMHSIRWWCWRIMNNEGRAYQYWAQREWDASLIQQICPVGPCSK